MDTWHQSLLSPGSLALGGGQEVGWIAFGFLGRVIEDLLLVLSRGLPLLGELLLLVLPQVIKLVAPLYNAATLPETLLLFVAAVLVSSIVLFLFAALHLTARAVKRGRALVFISYQHDLESIANGLKEAMTRAWIVPDMLAFEDREHDTMLDRIQRGITEADVVICLPGNSPSFVESEVFLASGLKKPMLFVLSADQGARLPNTAKKGYPLFDMEALRRADWLPIARFASYLSGDARFIVHLYGSVLDYVKSCAFVLACVYGLLIVLTTYIIAASRDLHPLRDDGSWLEVGTRAITHPLTISFIVPALFIIFVPYWLFLVRQRRLRSRVCETVSGQHFNARLLPDTLVYGLKRVDLERVRLTTLARPHHEDDALPEHERQVASGPSTDPIIVRANRTSLAVHVLWAALCWCLAISSLVVLALHNPPPLGEAITKWFPYATVAVVFICLATAVLIAVGKGIVLIVPLVRGGQLRVDTAGISDSLLNREHGHMKWDQVINVSLERKSETLELKLSAQDRFVEIKVHYFAISPESLLSLILDYRAMHRAQATPPGSPDESAVVPAA